MVWAEVCVHLEKLDDKTPSLQKDQAESQSSLSCMQGEEAELIGRSQMALARTLVQALSYKGGHKQARDVADKLLERLLARCRQVFF